MKNKTRNCNQYSEFVCYSVNECALNILNAHSKDMIEIIGRCIWLKIANDFDDGGAHHGLWWALVKEHD